MALWGGRFSKKPNDFFCTFNNSLNIDFKLAKYDILSSIAWSRTLTSINILTKLEQKKIEEALLILLNKVKKNPKIMLNSKAEDIHTWIEQQLITMVGSLGKKLHTGRSRNDQVTTDLKLWCKYKVNKLIQEIKNLKKTLIITAESNIDIILPGYTHLQRAQPIVFSHWCLAYLEMFTRDNIRLKDSFKRMNFNPLGSGALSGTAWKIDRKSLSTDMGFSSETKNSLDSVSDRDYVLDLLSASAISMMHLSRFSEDLIFFNSGEANFIQLSDDITSGSSLMPQKKNPDCLELIRAKSGRVYGSLINTLVVFKGLPLSYNKDMQEDKEGLFDSLKTWSNCLKMASLVLKNMKINKKICRQAAEQGYSNATELADYLVKKGVEFRSAHNIVGNIVLEAIKKNKNLDQLNLLTLKKYSNVIDQDVYHHLKLENILEKRSSKGGICKKQILFAIKEAKKKIFDTK
ncbi:argininosuccinate lyase [Buchnera aphidicola]|uniref:Argininosuccinate lyase n=1 Tax=Buchnera aphidicola (Anoecia oenotherae) TaxID=1241833 RepID=A0A4D6XPI2_9GAMM|nr:argininosuccinate lyase [Buchnera aphidicola]QCI19182.1 argininosuccinate lyase [Buchnera aphidicola (Anoecia oenotherae)]